MSLLLQKLTNFILKHSSEIELDIIRLLKEYGEEIRVEGMSTYIEGHGQVNILFISLENENKVLIHLSDCSTIGLEYLDGLQLLRIYDFIVYV
jgi:hypothetical protein